MRPARNLRNICNIINRSRWWERRHVITNKSALKHYSFAFADEKPDFGSQFAFLRLTSFVATAILNTNNYNEYTYLFCIHTQKRFKTTAASLRFSEVFKILKVDKITNASIDFSKRCNVYYSSVMLMVWVVATVWTGVNMSTPLLSLVVPGIDANPVASFTGRGRGSVMFGAWIARLQYTA